MSDKLQFVVVPDVVDKLKFVGHSLNLLNRPGVFTVVSNQFSVPTESLDTADAKAVTSC